MSVWICKDAHCKFSGKDKHDGYPVCKHPMARDHCDKDCDDLTEADLVDMCYPAQVGMTSCPLNLWRFSGDRRVPVTQSLLVEYYASSGRAGVQE